METTALLLLLDRLSRRVLSSFDQTFPDLNEEALLSLDLKVESCDPGFRRTRKQAWRRGVEANLNVRSLCTSLHRCRH